MTTHTSESIKDRAVRFAKLLANRNYSDAYEMTTQEYKKRVSLEQLQQNFETIIPLDWGPVKPVEVGEIMNDWPGKAPPDLGWVYVSLGGDVYSEAVIVILSEENAHPKVREVEFGRP